MLDVIVYVVRGKKEHLKLVESETEETIFIMKRTFTVASIQCVKFRAVLEAMHSASVEAILVTEDPLIPDHEKLIGKHKIRHYKASQDRRGGESP